ncbi:hypothetical protein MFMK1_000801 [Metallumcola ferriviriculae]|uniref:Uncharacterized protein n=1 Tax=Metallumcola ferriviriculae TaxID=3039180 RepID=A0AAU0UJB1_9FIRM|nr:hypothetical protein MFMK1_000801 [Desulfitibacteraceae bacterium MK1]
MSKHIKVEKDKEGNFKVIHSLELDEQGLLGRKKQLEKSIKAYDFQLKGMTEAKAQLQAELDSINQSLVKENGGT